MLRNARAGRPHADRDHEEEAGDGEVRGAAAAPARLETQNEEAA